MSTIVVPSAPAPAGQDRARGPVIRVSTAAPPLEAAAFLDEVRARVARGERPLTLFGRPDGGAVVVTAALAGLEGLAVVRGAFDPARSYPALTRDLAAFQAFERELFEQTGLVPRDHPWLKPVRSPSGAPPMEDYPFFRLEGKEVHEVGVGPIHAGVIEPGHFRFMCLGEVVHHLEIQLGYQHRGVEALLLGRPPQRLAQVVESVAGDTVVANATAYARAIEALAGAPARPDAERVRAVGLELERIAMHLASLTGMCNDVAFLPGSSTYGRLRTAAINATQRLCGNRFGRGWVRPGGVRAGLGRGEREWLREALAAMARDLALVDDLTLSSRTVRHRLEGTGVVAPDLAARLGLVGMAARASGQPIDLRTTHPDRVFAARPVPMAVEPGGDCLARLRVRVREVDASVRWLQATLEHDGDAAAGVVEPGPLEARALVVSAVEGWRGEVVHCLETDAQGGLVHYKVQDPSLVNWFGLAQAVRGNAISDFPICNKSFDLSYCGSDL